MIVVSDTSPLNYLVLIGQVGVLPKLFEEIHTAPEVMDELLDARTPEVVRQWAQAPPGWLRVSRCTTRMEVPGKLGAGEANAIALAKELGINWLLMDERDVARFARGHGLCVIETLAVLEQAASRRLLNLPDALRRLQTTTFRVSLPLLRALLERDAARRPDDLE